MCTNIATTTPMSGSAKTAAGWTPVSEATITCDHASHVWSEHALRMDFTGARGVGDGHVAVEMDLASARALLEQLRRVIEVADASGVS